MNEAILYILYHSGHNAVKIGISNISGKRYKSHRTKGWELVAYWHFFERDKAKTIESIVVQTLDYSKTRFPIMRIGCFIVYYNVVYLI